MEGGNASVDWMVFGDETADWLVRLKAWTDGCAKQMVVEGCCGGGAASHRVWCLVFGGASLSWCRVKGDNGHAHCSRRSELTDYLGENPGGNLGTAQANPCCWLTPIGS